MLKDTLDIHRGMVINDDKTYPYWKIKFELDQSNPEDFSNWYNIEDIDTTTSLTDESLMMMSLVILKVHIGLVILVRAILDMVLYFS